MLTAKKTKLLFATSEIAVALCHSRVAPIDTDMIHSGGNREIDCTLLCKINRTELEEVSSCLTLVSCVSAVLHYTITVASSV